MRKLFMIMLAAFLSPQLMAQAYEGSIEFSKKMQDAFIVDFSYSTEAVENGLTKKMEALGYKTKEEKGLFNKDKGFRIYKSVFINEISSGSMDYVFKVEQKSRKEKEETQLFMIMMNGSENLAKSLDSHSTSKAKDFLNNLLPEVEAANLELQIKAQEDVVLKSEKKLKSQETDLDDMSKKLKKLQEDMEQNKKDQERQSQDIINQRNSLDNLKGKRKTN